MGTSATSWSGSTGCSRDPGAADLARHRALPGRPSPYHREPDAGNSAEDESPTPPADLARKHGESPAASD